MGFLAVASWLVRRAIARQPWPARAGCWAAPITCRRASPARPPRCWRSHPTSVEAAELEARYLPPVFSPGEVIGRVDATAAAATHLPVGTPVVGGHVDGLLGVLGSGVQNVGDACMNCGTSGTFSSVCPPPLGYPLLGLNIAGSATNTSGIALDWFAQSIARAGLVVRRAARWGRRSPARCGRPALPTPPGGRTGAPTRPALARRLGRLDAGPRSAPPVALAARGRRVQLPIHPGLARSERGPRLRGALCRRPGAQRPVEPDQSRCAQSTRAGAPK